MGYSEEKYQKIEGLKKLKELGLSVPSYLTIEFPKDDRLDITKEVIEKIQTFKIPKKTGTAVGVTLRVSLPGTMDKSAKHGSLHILTKQKLLNEIMEKYKIYGRQCKIIVQDTIDARSSGAMLREDNRCIVETIPGDAPALLEGKTDSYESWEYSLFSKSWNQKCSFLVDGKIYPILIPSDRETFERIIAKIPNNSYLEWSISKSNNIFFYEFMQFTRRLLDDI
jgi:hypothetical protein